MEVVVVFALCVKTWVPLVHLVERNEFARVCIEGIVT
jgi:hypothetical protein